MKNKIIISIILMSTLLTGCSTGKLHLDKPEPASSYVDSHVNAVSTAKYEITGTSEVEPGDYVVYPYAGQTCTIDDGETGQEFDSRDFIHISNTISLNIKSGYILPIDKAPAYNADIVTDGVYLVGFDTLPETNKIGSNGMVVVSNSIPELFSKPDKDTKAKYTEFEAADGMLVKLVNTPLVNRPQWSISNRVASFWNSYRNTAIGNIGYDEDYQSDTFGYDVVYLLALNNLDEAKTAVNGYAVRLDTTDASGVKFTYGDKKYAFPETSVFIVVQDISKLKPESSVVTTKQKISEAFSDENEKVWDSSATQYKLVESDEMLKVLQNASDTINSLMSSDDSSYATSSTSFTVLRPSGKGTEEIELDDLQDLELGDAVKYDSHDNPALYTDETLDYYKAVLADLDDSIKLTISNGSTVPKADTKTGFYKIESGKLEYAEDSVDTLSITGDDGEDLRKYIPMYSGVKYKAVGDTTLVGATYADVLSYYENLKDGTHEEEDTESSDSSEDDSNKVTKEYQLNKDTTIIIGDKIGANLYTFTTPVDVTVTPSYTSRSKTYKKCRQLILQEGDTITVSEDTVVTALVSPDMLYDNDSDVTLSNESTVGTDIDAGKYTAVTDNPLTVRRGDGTNTIVMTDQSFEVKDGDIILSDTYPILLNKEEDESIESTEE